MSENNIQKKINKAKQVNHTEKPIEDPQIIIRTENNYKGMGRAVFLFTASILVLLGLSISLNIMSFVELKNPNDRYFTVDENLRIVELTPLNEPYISDSALINWATETVAESFTMSFADWRSALNKISSKYDKHAFDSFIKSLKNSGNLSFIIDKRLNTIVNIDGPAIISAQGISLSTKRYTWDVEVPIIINYESSEGVKATQRVLINVTIHRVSTLETSRGIRIKSLRSSPRSKR